MKKTILQLSLMTAIAALNTTNASAGNKISDEYSLQQAIAAANADSSITKLVFRKNAEISLTAPVIYSGRQALTLIGNGATIDGSAAGSFTLDEDLSAVTEDGTLIFNTASDITINKLSVINNATRGIVVNIPADAEGDDITVNLKKVTISHSALYGLHIDDNANEFDDGSEGSAIGVNLNIVKSSFIANGTGAIDFDGVRVDERAEGDINAVIIQTHIDANGGDGVELDEAGAGDVEATMVRVSISDNGFYNEADLDDGFDIDEAGDGDIEVNLIKVTANNNMDEGLDFDEAGEGDVELKLRRVTVDNNADEGIKVDEENGGNIEAKLSKVKVSNGGDDGVQFTELGGGKIEAELRKVTADNNAKYGIKMEQWFIEDEDSPVEEAGELKVKKVSLQGNGKGDELKTNNIITK